MKQYIFSIVVFCLVPLISAGPIPEEFQEVAPEMRRICMAESGATVEFIDKAANGEFIPEDSLKCYMKCLFEQFRLISKKGVNYMGMVRLAPADMKETVIKVADTCRDVKGKEDDLCDLAYEVNKCFYNTAPEQYFIM